MEALEAGGIAIPKLGLGTYRLTGDACRAAVESALALGYRHLDTAEMYGNEEAVGAAIAASDVPRNEIHVTTKAWVENLAPDALHRAFDISQRKLGLDTVDLYLIHWPAPDMKLGATLEAMLRLKEEGRIRAVGVANFPVALLRQAVEEVGAPIACNQVEYHVCLDQSALLAYQRQKGIPLVAYCPVAQGRLAEDATLAGIGAKHGASPTQVALKWLLDQDIVVPIPKAGRQVSQQANLDAFGIALDDDDRAAIAAMRKDLRCVNPGFAPDWD